MKFIFTCLSIFISIHFLVSGQCTGNIFLKTQAEVDAFSEVYDCDTLFGGLFVGGNIDTLSDIVDLTPLGNLPIIKGELSIIYNPGLTTLNGLSGEYIELGLLIRSNESLTDIAALSSISYFGNNFILISNPLLLSIPPLQNFTNINGILVLDDNDSLEDISGFSNIESLDFLFLFNNDVLTDLSAFDNLQEAESINIQYNPSLTSIDGFNNLIKLDSDISISSNESLLSINGFQGLEEVNNFTISNNSNFELLPTLPNLKKIRGNLRIADNSELSDCCQILCWSSKTAGLVNIFNNASFACSYVFFDSFSCDDDCSFDSCDDNILIREQNDIDYLTELNCEEITGNLKIQGQYSNSIDDLSELMNISSVGGFLSITSNSDLPNLSGLENISSVGEDIIINFNSGLETLQSLDGLNTIGGDLKIENNALLSSFIGLQNIESIVRDFRISNNDNLIELNGLNNLVSIGEDLVISSNDTLDNLNNLNTLNSVGSLSISFNNNLKTISGLGNISGIDGRVFINRNDSLKNLEGLENLSSIESLSISNNISLANLDALSNLNDIDDRLSITSNQNLVDISGLDSVSTIGGNITIADNILLSDCCPIKCLLEKSAGITLVENNAANCNSLTEIAEVCMDVNCVEIVEPMDTIEMSIRELLAPKLISIYPNPSEGQLYIDYKETSTYEILVYNNTGQLLFQKENVYGLSKLQIDQIGVFTILINTNEGQLVKRIVVH